MIRSSIARSASRLSNPRGLPTSYGTWERLIRSSSGSINPTISMADFRGVKGNLRPFSTKDGGDDDKLDDNIVDGDSEEVS